MSQVKACPKCSAPVAVPDSADPQAHVRCPVCHAEYALYEAADHRLPEFHLLPAGHEPTMFGEHEGHEEFKFDDQPSVLPLTPTEVDWHDAAPLDLEAGAEAGLFADHGHSDAHAEGDVLTFDSDDELHSTEDPAHAEDAPMMLHGDWGVHTPTDAADDATLMHMPESHLTEAGHSHEHGEHGEHAEHDLQPLEMAEFDLDSPLDLGSDFLAAPEHAAHDMTTDFSHGEQTLAFGSTHEAGDEEHAPLEFGGEPLNFEAPAEHVVHPSAGGEDDEFGFMTPGDDMSLHGGGDTPMVGQDETDNEFAEPFAMSDDADADAEMLGFGDSPEQHTGAEDHESADMMGEFAMAGAAAAAATGAAAGAKGAAAEKKGKDKKPTPAKPKVSSTEKGQRKLGKIMMIVVLVFLIAVPTVFLGLLWGPKMDNLGLAAYLPDWAVPEVLAETEINGPSHTHNTPAPSPSANGDNGTPATPDNSNPGNGTPDNPGDATPPKNPLDPAAVVDPNAVPNNPDGTPKTLDSGDEKMVDKVPRVGVTPKTPDPADPLDAGKTEKPDDDPLAVKLPNPIDVVEDPLGLGKSPAKPVMKPKTPDVVEPADPLADPLATPAKPATVKPAGDPLDPLADPLAGPAKPPVKPEPGADPLDPPAKPEVKPAGDPLDPLADPVAPPKKPEVKPAGDPVDPLADPLAPPKKPDVKPAGDPLDPLADPLAPPAKPDVKPIEKPEVKPAGDPLDPLADPLTTPAKPEVKPEIKLPVTDPVSDVKPTPDPLDPLTNPSKEPVKPEVVKTTPKAGVKDAPAYKVGDLMTAGLNASLADTALKSVDSTKGPELNKARASYYKTLCRLAETLTFTPTNVDRETALNQVQSLAADRDRSEELGAIAGFWLNSPARKESKENGIVLAGKVKSTKSQGDLFETTLVLFGNSAKEVLLLSDTKPAVEADGSLLVVGSVVAKPAENIAGYKGTEEEAIWIGAAYNVAAPKK